MFSSRYFAAEYWEANYFQAQLVSISPAGNAARFSTGAAVMLFLPLRAGNAARFSTGVGASTLIDCCEINTAHLLLIESLLARMFRRMDKMDDDHAYIIRLLRILDADIRRDHSVQNAARKKIDKIAEVTGAVGNTLATASIGERENRLRDKGLKIPGGKFL
jgi:hypothetical protein